MPYVDLSAGGFLSGLNPNAVAGFAAGFVSSSVLYPLEVVKSRFQVGSHSSFSYRSSLNALKTIYTSEGLRELYRGFPAGLAGSSLSWGMYFWLYNNLKVSLSEARGSVAPGAIEHWSSSILASVAVQTLLCPLWVVKLNQQLGYVEGFWQGVGNLWNKEGMRGLYRGLVPGYWSSVHLAIQLVLYEELRGVKYFDSSLVGDTIIATVLSKSAATVLTSPIEVIKTRLRSSKVDLAQNIRSISVEIFKREGMRGFYKGVGTALMRILPVQMSNPHLMLMFMTYFVSGDGECNEISSCTAYSRKNSSLDWSHFSSQMQSLPSNITEKEAILQKLSIIYGSHPGVVHECRMGLASVFYQLSQIALSRNRLQTSHNLNQLAMAMLWDTTRTHLNCLQAPVWGLDWLGHFMQDYLGLAARLRRHEDVGLLEPFRGDPEFFSPEKIAIASVCDYGPEHKLHGIDSISKRNRDQYASKHGYISVFKSVNDDAPGRHPVWASLALARTLLQSGSYEIVMWMDCDALFIDQSRKIEEILGMYPGKDIYISEDGRGLSAGNWIVRNSGYTLHVLSSVLENPYFDEWDLRDQFGLLWTLLRPSINSEIDAASPLGYPSQVALIPQRLLNAYPWALCRPSHHCFEDDLFIPPSLCLSVDFSREMTSVLASVSPKAHKYDALRSQLSELNYLYPFSPDSVPLIEALLSDLVSTVTTYKELEGEHAITKEQLRLAVEEINRLGVVENPRLVKENNELHVRLIQESDRTESKLGLVRKEAAEKEERGMKLELMVNQLEFENQELKVQNEDLALRVDQLMGERGGMGEEDLCSIWVSSSLDYAADLPCVFTPSNSEKTNNNNVVIVAHLAEENTNLNKLVSELNRSICDLKQNYASLESKFLNQSPLSLSGNWQGGDSSKLICELNAKLDFVNDRYKELKELHARCGIVSDAPLVDLRESRKELNLMSVRFEKLKSEKQELLNELESLRKKTNKASKLPVKEEIAQKEEEENVEELFKIENRVLIEAMKDENRKLRKQVEVVKRDNKELSNTLRLREKELKISKSSVTVSPTRAGDRREVILLEEQLRQVTQDRDELMDKLGEIEKSIEAMEKEIVKIETENVQLKREKIIKEESFVGISQQLSEVNSILNSLSEEAPNEERLRFRIRQLEALVSQKEKEIAEQAIRKTPTTPSDAGKRDGEIQDLKALTKSLNSAKEQLVAQVKQLQNELNEKRVLIEKYRSDFSKQEMSRELETLKQALTSLDAERDDLQRVCDEQTEKLDVAAKQKEELLNCRREFEKYRHIVQDKEAELVKMDSKTAGMKTEIERKILEADRLQNEVNSAAREIAEITRDNQSLVAELNRVRNQLNLQVSYEERNREQVRKVMETLRITESERNDILAMYRQLIAERNSFDELNFEKGEAQKELAQVNLQLVAQCRQAEIDVATLRAQLSDLSARMEMMSSSRRQDPAIVDDINRNIMHREKFGLEKPVSNSSLNAQIKDLLSLVESERSKNRELQEYVEALSAVKLGGGEDVEELKRTIEQQYALIGEMDAEQSRLILQLQRNQALVP